MIGVDIARRSSTQSSLSLSRPPVASSVSSTRSDVAGREKHAALVALSIVFVLLRRQLKKPLRCKHNISSRSLMARYDEKTKKYFFALSSLFCVFILYASYLSAHFPQRLFFYHAACFQSKGTAVCTLYVMHRFVAFHFFFSTSFYFAHFFAVRQINKATEKTRCCTSASAFVTLRTFRTFAFFLTHTVEHFCANLSSLYISLFVLIFVHTPTRARECKVCEMKNNRRHRRRVRSSHIRHTIQS